MFRIYLAGPISGLNYKEATGWRKDIAHEFKGLEVQCLSPMRAKEKLQNVNVISGSYEECGCLYSSRGIMSRDYNDCTTSDLVIFNLSGTKVASIGTIMELAWCYQKKIPTVVIMEEDNIHCHPMVSEAISFRVKDVDEAIGVALTVLGL